MVLLHWKQKKNEETAVPVWNIHKMLRKAVKVSVNNGNEHIMACNVLWSNIEFQKWCRPAYDFTDYPSTCK